MSRRLFVSVVVLAVIAGALIGYIRGLPDDLTNSRNNAISSDTPQFTGN